MVYSSRTFFDTSANPRQEAPDWFIWTCRGRLDPEAVEAAEGGAHDRDPGRPDVDGAGGDDMAG